MYGRIEALKRFKDEHLRTLGVLEIRLSGKFTGESRDYLAGKGKGKYSVADIGTWSELFQCLVSYELPIDNDLAWVSGWEVPDVITKEDMKPFPHLLKWIDRIAEVSNASLNPVTFANKNSDLLSKAEPTKNGKIGDSNMSEGTYVK